MASVSEIYNALPTLGEADDRFVDRAATIAAVSQLLARYGGKCNMCLIHAHCSLADDAIMVAKGSISEPTLLAQTGLRVYPERWLPTGEAYEFTTEHTEVPPQELVAEFAQLTRAAPVLGLCYAGDATAALPLVERTEGRRNVTEPLLPSQSRDNLVETAWSVVGNGGVIVQAACAIYCDTRITRLSSVHKNTKTHIRQ